MVLLGPGPRQGVSNPASLGLPMDEVLVAGLVVVLSINKSMFLNHDKKEHVLHIQKILCLSRMIESTVYANFISL